MDLREYIFRHRLVMKDFAAKTGYSNVYMQSIKDKRVKPSKKVIRAIIKASKGEITAEDLQWTVIETREGRKISA